MTNIVEKLRETANWEMMYSNFPHTEHVAWKAADEIERLRGLLREAYHDVTTCYFNAIDSREALMCDHYSDLLARIDAALGENKMFAEELNDRVNVHGSGENI